MRLRTTQQPAHPHTGALTSGLEAKSQGPGSNDLGGGQFHEAHHGLIVLVAAYGIISAESLTVLGGSGVCRLGTCGLVDECLPVGTIVAATKGSVRLCALLLGNCHRVRRLRVLQTLRPNVGGPMVQNFPEASTIVAIGFMSFSWHLLQYSKTVVVFVVVACSGTDRGMSICQLPDRAFADLYIRF